MLILADVFIYQNKIMNEGKHHLNCLYHSKQLWWWYCTVSEHVAKVRNRTL